MTVWCEADLGLPTVTKIFARGADTIGQLGLVYQRLPLCRSGPDPAADHLYQAPPPGNKDRYYVGLELYVWAIDVGQVWGYELVPIYFTFGIGLVVFGLCE